MPSGTESGNPLNENVALLCSHLTLHWTLQNSTLIPVVINMTLVYHSQWLSECICENHKLQFLLTWRLRHSVNKCFFLHDNKSWEVSCIICKNKWWTMAVSRRALQWQIYASKWDWCQIFTIHILQTSMSFITPCQI